MYRALCGLMLVVAISLFAMAAEQADPLRYDLVINGETFSIVADRTNKLVSRRKPGTTYEVALRIAQIQKLVLNTLEFDYDRGFRANDDRGRSVRTVSLQHQLGFTMMVSDLGNDLKPGQLRATRTTLQDSLVKSFVADKSQDLAISPPETVKFPNASGEMISIRFQNAAGVPQSCLIYVMTSGKCSYSCVVQSLDADADDAWPLVKAVIESVKPRLTEPGR